GYGHFTITKDSVVKCKYKYSVDSTGVYKFPHTEFEIKLSKVNSLTTDRYLGCFDFKSVEFPIEIRNFRHGDRFIPFGMKGLKKVKRFFIDEKVPRFLRNRIPIFLSKGEIMWVGGMRVDERYKVKNKGKEILTIKLLKPNFERIHFQ
ncbi:MAG: tRNA lysidine(34) synthetase TilS, partial [Thermodesulfobacteriota bacterium]